MVKIDLSKKNDKRQLLIEACEFVSKVKVSRDVKKELKESLKISKGDAGTLIVRNIPCTILNRENLNGRIYSTQVLQQAINEAKENFLAKNLLSQADEHPETSYTAPTHASHVVINAYIKKGVTLTVDGQRGKWDVLLEDWEILNTVEGKNLRALIEAGCSLGTSIRGCGDVDDKYVVDYSFYGTDCVSLPSSSTFMRMPISESAYLELSKPKLEETFTLTTSSTNVVRDLEAAANMQEKLDAIGYGTVTKTSTKVDEETDPKTGAQTSITTLEAETEDDTATLEQALMMAKNAMTNGVVNVDSITIENIKDEEPKEAVEVKQEAPLNEEEAMTESSMVIDRSVSGRYTLMWNKDDPFSIYDKELDKIIYTNFDQKRIEKVFSKLKNEDALNVDQQESAEAVYLPMKEENQNITEALNEEALKVALDYKLGTSGYSVALKGSMENLAYIKKNLQQPMSGIYAVDGPYMDENNNGTLEFVYNLDENEFNNLLRTLQNKMHVRITESLITEAKEDKKEDPNTGKKFVLKTPAGFVAMDGNALVFKDDPKEALHFVVGKEESGLVHLSGVEKILDTMGVYDVEKYYRKDITDISAPDANTTAVVTEEPAKEEAFVDNNVVKPMPGTEHTQATDLQETDHKDEDTPHRSEEDIREKEKIDIEGPEANPDQTNQGNTQYNATVTVTKENGQVEEDTIPISGVGMDSIISEVSNLYAMKAQKGNANVVVNDNVHDKHFQYNPQTNKLDPLVPTESLDQPVKEDFSSVGNSDGPIKQDDNKLSVELDDDITVEKEFDSPTQASIAKSGIESGKLDGDIMLDDMQEASPEYQDIEPGWYVGSQEIGISGPYQSKEEALSGLEDYQDIVSVEYIGPEDLGIAAESMQMDEVLFTGPEEPSDNEIDRPLDEADDEDSVHVRLSNIDWDVDSAIQNLGNNDDVYDAVQSLPDTLEVTLSAKDIDEKDDVDAIRNALFTAASKQAGIIVRDARIDSID